jgi:hypothetical protein
VEQVKTDVQPIKVAQDSTKQIRGSAQFLVDARISEGVDDL